MIGPSNRCSPHTHRLKFANACSFGKVIEFCGEFEIMCFRPVAGAGGVGAGAGAGAGPAPAGHHIRRDDAGRVDFVAVGTLDTVIPRLTSAGSKNPNFRRRLRDHVRQGGEARNVAA